MNPDEKKMDEPSTDCTINSTEKNCWWRKQDILVPLISLLLTPIFSFVVSFVVVNFQLSRQQNFADSQQQIAREQIKIDHKIQLHEKAIKLIGVTSCSRNASAVTHLFAAIELKYLLDGLENYRDEYNKSVKDSSDLILETSRNYSELRATLEIARFYFGIETQHSINNLFDFYSSNSSIETPELEKIVEEFRKNKNNGTSDALIVTQLQNKLNANIDNDNYIKLGVKVTNAMMSEIANDLKLRPIGMN